MVSCSPLFYRLLSQPLLFVIVCISEWGSFEPEVSNNITYWEIAFGAHRNIKPEIAPWESVNINPVSCIQYFGIPPLGTRDVLPQDAVNSGIVSRFGYVYISRDASQQQNCSSAFERVCHRDFEMKEAVQLSLPFMQSSLAFLNYFKLFSFHIFSTFSLSSSAFQSRVNRLVTHLSLEARNPTHVCMWDLWSTQ